LEVVVAAGLSLELQSSLLLAAYAVAAFFTLAVFFLHRSAQRFEASAASAQKEVAMPGWPSARPVAYQQAGEQFLGGQLPGWRCVRHVAVMALASASFAGVFFCAAPRRASPMYRAPAKRQVGFTRRVRLDEIERLLLSDELVMRVSFWDAAGKKNYAVRGAPYYRGVALNTYSFEDGVGVWGPGPLGQRRRLPDAAILPPGAEIVRQEVLLEPTEERNLFGVFPVFQTEQTPRDVRLIPASCQLHRGQAPQSQMGVQYRYELATSAFRNGVQSPLLPHGNHAAPDDLGVLEAEKEHSLAFDANRFPGLRNLAERIVREDAGGDSDPVVRARAMEQHFLAPGAYAYSRQPPRPTSPGADPIEAFVAVHRRGHCEYFASALVMMLRSQGIPARMVIGYRGGEFNSVGRFYLVRELHAHAWVEAYLAPEEIPREMPGDASSTLAGAWLQLDPTPAADDESVAGGLLSKVDESLGYAQVLWRDYILGLETHQQRSFFDPLLAGTAGLLGDTRSFTLDIARLLIGGGFIRIAGAAVFGLLMLLLAYRLAGRLRRRARAFSAGLRRRRRSDRFVRVDFYQRLEQLLARSGLRRAAAQTQREFAAAADAILADGPALQSVAAVPRRIVEAFYRVRFGGSTLDSREVEAIELELARLEAALSAANSGRVSR
jgi:hypothetical protein